MEFPPVVKPADTIVVDESIVDTKPKYLIIRDVMSEDQRSDEILEEQLETAFESRVRHIIIEPPQVSSFYFSSHHSILYVP